MLLKWRDREPFSERICNHLLGADEFQGHLMILNLFFTTRYLMSICLDLDECLLLLEKEITAELS
ncbi:hypothetical protein PJO47_29295, partial [Mycobacterium kansasii]